MANTDQCREIKQLNILAQALLTLALEDIKKQGINPLVVETYRNQERQKWLYAQGRTRELSKPKVTWTLNSIHTLKNAVDLVPQREVNKEMVAIWNARDKETLAMIKTMIRYGFEAGANWKSNVDSPHFQISGISSTAKEYSVSNTNKFITLMIQKALNRKLDVKLSVDGKWGAATNNSVNEFRRQNNWSSNGKLGSLALKTLLT